MDIRLVNLTKIFADKNSEVRAVDNLTIDIPSGKLIGLLGPSGCGKSTTLYMISGLMEPSSGQIFFGDEDVTELPAEKRGIGLVFQNYALYPHMTIKQNIMFPLQNMKLSKVEAYERLHKYAKLVGIEELLNRKPKQLSGGQQQRVAIARALVKEPRVLLLDEPLSNLDARLRLQTREEIKRIQRETGITTIFVTHDQEEAMSISDEIVVMNFGVKQQIDHPQKVYENPVNQFVAKFLGNPPINIVEGKVVDKKLYLADGTYLEDIEAEDADVQIGIRPEFFKVDPEGQIEVKVDIVEHIGRDTMVIFNLEGSEKSIRAIVPSENEIEVDTTVRFGYSKLFVFDNITGGRIK